MKQLLILFIGVYSFFISAKTTNEIENEIKKHKNSLVHVHADWCPTCKEQTKIFNKINNRNFSVIEVDFDKDKEFLEKNKIFKQSMLLAYQNGKEVKRVFGITKEDKIKKFIKESFDSQLQAKLDARRASSKISSDKRMTMEQATEELRKSGIIAKAKNVGDKVVDFSLKDLNGKTLKLSEEYKKQPIILTFYRGGWCPYCNLQLRVYQERLDDFKKAGGKLIAVSPESKDSASTTSQKNDVKFTIVQDELNKVAREYGLVFKLSEKLKEVYLSAGLDLEKNQGNDSWELPIPATYVIDTNGIIKFAFLNVDYVKRAEPSTIIEELNKLKK